MLKIIGYVRQEMLIESSQTKTVEEVRDVTW